MCLSPGQVFHRGLLQALFDIRHESLEHPLEKSPLLLQNIRELILALLVLIRCMAMGMCRCMFPLSPF
jgi:hypothetical protein